MPLLNQEPLHPGLDIGGIIGGGRRHVVSVYRSTIALVSVLRGGQQRGRLAWLAASGQDTRLKTVFALDRIVGQNATRNVQ
jgi:hypothetical protein